MTQQSIEDYLNTHPFFSELEKQSKKFLSDTAGVVNIEQGDVLFKLGNSADKFYLLKSGEISVQVPALEGPSLEIQKLKAGQLLGWSWLIPPYRWNFQARALEDSELLEFDGSIILAHCEEEPAFGYAVLKLFAGLMSERLDRARQKMMDQWEPAGFA